MAKGYWIGRIDVNNEDGFKPYGAANQPIFKKFGGRYLVRGGKFDAAEGHTRSRNVARLLSLARISGKHQGPPAALHSRFGRNRGLRGAPAISVEKSKSECASGEA